MNNQEVFGKTNIEFYIWVILLTLNDFLNGSNYLPFWAFIIRATILYFALILATRLMKPRQVGILSGHNYLVAAGIVSLAAVRMVNPKSSLIAGVVIVLLYAGVNVFLSYLDIKFPKKVDRHSVVLMENGIINKDNMRDAHVTINNLLGQLRLKNIFNISEAEMITLEPTGKVNVLKKSKLLPVNKKQMNISTNPVYLTTIIIYDGKLEQDELKRLNLNKGWVEGKIKEKGIKDITDVFLMLIQTDGSLYISI